MRDIKMIFEFRDKLPLGIFPFMMVLESLTDSVYLVGGSVRDMLLGAHPNDFDFVTDVPMEQLIAEFEAGGFTVTQSGVAHLVLNVGFGDTIVEISNFRKDKACDGRHAVVELGTIDDDAHRRDFTINALFLNTKTGEVVDPTGNGVADLKAKVLRFVGKPKDRIREDYLRGWRAMRFASRGFKLEPKSLRAVREMWKEIYDNSTPERVRVELEKMAGI